jgi:hypothetical protein
MRVRVEPGGCRTGWRHARGQAGASDSDSGFVRARRQLVRQLFNPRLVVAMYTLGHEQR